MKNTASFLSDPELLSKTKKLVHEERELTVKILWHLREVEKRMLFARRGFRSLYEYATEELGYSEGAAHRRIASMRLLKELPDLESKVESGALPLSTLAQAHSFFRTENIRESKVKREIILGLENKSHREVQKELITRSTQPEKHFHEVLKPVSATHHQMSILLDEQMLKDLEELQGILSSSKEKLSLQEVVRFAIKEALEIKRPKIPKALKVPKTFEVSKAEIPTPALELEVGFESKSKEALRPIKIRSRYIPAEIKREVWSRDKGCCSFKDIQTGKLCGSKWGLEMDHIQDFASGGLHTADNLRLRCRAHNILAAVDRFGAQKMSQFVGSLQ